MRGRRTPAGEREHALRRRDTTAGEQLTIRRERDPAEPQPVAPPRRPWAAGAWAPRAAALLALVILIALIALLVFRSL
ncbi:MAG TPA: hypothetical protein VHJ37_07830 [Thermoleophilaceae bacterium]|nr:hypothetical protein [Thermoleophilaceae bacterium]